MPGKANFIIYQGSTFKQPLTVKTAGVALDLSGCLVRMNMAPNVGSPLVFSTASGHIVITNALAGKFTITITDEATTLYTWSSAKYDIHIEFSNGEVFPLLEGKIKLHKKV